MNCQPCHGTGFVNTEQLPDASDGYGVADIEAWLKTPEGQASDVATCSCCGDGTGWYGEPGRHYGADDPSGSAGPYAYNGGLCECH